MVAKKKSNNSSERLRKIVNKFKNIRVLVVGDLMWDEYLHGTCNRISPEAPVPVVQVTGQSRVPGGATNVLKNLVDLQIPSGIMGIVGADKDGRDMIKELNTYNLHSVQIWESNDRPTIVKTRVVAQNQQLMRLDRELNKPISTILENKVLQAIKRKIKNFNAIILSDYDKGMLTPKVIQGIIKEAKKNNVYIAVDPQVRHFDNYVGADVLTPNEKEASDSQGLPFPQKEADIKDIGQKIKEKLNLNHLLITRSHKGMALFEGSNTPVYVPTIAKEVYDVSGAGDSVVAVFTSAISAGATPLEATILSNIAGGIVVGKLGTATISRNEILSSIDAFSGKLK